MFVLRESIRIHLCFSVFFYNAIVSASIVIQNGTINGVVDEVNSVEKFLGIPFAQPPINEFRLQQAMPLRKPFGTLEAKNFGPGCLSTRDQGDSSEDCLTINLWRPIERTQNGSLPVLLWLYGGGLTAGSAVSAHCNAPADMTLL